MQIYAFVVRLTPKRVNSLRKAILIALLCIVTTSLSAQTNPTLKFDKRSMSVSEIFNIISNQTGLGISINKDFDRTRQLSVAKGSMTLSETLDHILKGTDWKYVVLPEFVIIQKKDGAERVVSASPPELERITTATQKIEGTAILIGAGVPLSGAVINAIGKSAFRTTTDDAGTFVFEKLPIGEYKITISHNECGTLTYDIQVEQGKDEVVYFALHPKLTEILPAESLVLGLSSNNLDIRSILHYTSPASAQKMPVWSVKTNLLWDATGTINLGLEVRLSDRLTLDVPFNWNSWAGSRGKNKQFRHILVQPELRWWITEPFNRHFIGVHAHWAHYNISNIKLPLDIFPALKENRYQGDLYGVGFSYGYQWILSNRLNLEATLGAGYFYTKYERHGCTYCSDQIEKKSKHYFGPTKLGVSLIYIFK